jgi:hypothetical protein
MGRFAGVSEGHVDVGAVVVTESLGGRQARGRVRARRAW